MIGVGGEFDGGSGLGQFLHLIASFLGILNEGFTEGEIGSGMLQAVDLAGCLEFLVCSDGQIGVEGLGQVDDVVEGRNHARILLPLP